MKPTAAAGSLAMPAHSTSTHSKARPSRKAKMLTAVLRANRAAALRDHSRFAQL